MPDNDGYATPDIPDYVVVNWSEPEANGAEITSYTIYFRGSDYSEYHTTSACDGADPTIFANLECTVNVNVFKTDPYNVLWGDHIWVKVAANNIKGASVESNPGSGAMILTRADKPINLVELYQYRTKSVLSVDWDEGAANGGLPVLDYRFSMADIGTCVPDCACEVTPLACSQDPNIVGDFTVLVEGLEPTQFTINSLTAGNIYQMRVEARNVYGYSEYSDLITLLCAFKSEPTPAPTTTNYND